MLTLKRDFGAFQDASQSRSHPLLTVRMRANDLSYDRFGIATGRRLGGAVVRNRVRRRLRDILRRREPTGSDRGWDILVVARPASAAASYAELRAALLRLTTPPAPAGRPACR